MGEKASAAESEVWNFKGGGIEDMYVRPYTLFSTSHPAILLFYGLGAPILAMLSKAPACLITALFCACSIRGFYFGKKAVAGGIKTAVLFLILLGTFNMITNAGGLTVLFQIGERNFTLESLCFGMANGAMLGAVILWFGCFTAIVPNDRFLYLFSRRLQNTGLLLSMILKLFPETGYKITCIQMADDSAALGEKLSFAGKIKKGLRQMSCLLEWSMEDSIETADAMKARGYGVCKRSSYAVYRFSGFDQGFLAVMLLLFISAAAGVIRQDQTFWYFPSILWEAKSVFFTLATDMCALIFLLLPILLEIGAKGGKRTCRSWK